MGIFSKLFGNSEKRRAKEILRDVERKLRPISDLALAILSGSFSCGEALKPYLNAPTQKAKDALFVGVYCEFIYFFAHLMNRYALSIIGKEGRIKLQDEIAPLIVGPVISSFFENWPEAMKEKITNDFYDELNGAELDYSSCSKLMPPSAQVMFSEVLDDVESTPATYLFSKLISKIYTISGKSLCPEALVLLFGVSSKTLIDMKLEQHIEEIKIIL